METFQKEQQELSREFLQYKEKLKTEVCLYTDGSVDKILGKSGFSYYDEVHTDRKHYKINFKTSSYQVELLAILEALEYLDKKKLMERKF